MKEHHDYYFNSYPKSNEVFETADENLFHDEHAAKAHARNLDNKTVVRIERPEAPAQTGAKAVVETATAVVPNKGVNAVAPVVAQPDGTVISPGVGESSTSPVAAAQVVDEKTGKVIDPGTVDVNATVETEVKVEKPLTTDVPQEDAEAEKLAAEKAAKAEKAAAKKAEKAAAEKAAKTKE